MEHDFFFVSRREVGFFLALEESNEEAARLLLKPVDKLDDGSRWGLFFGSRMLGCFRHEILFCRSSRLLAGDCVIRLLVSDCSARRALLSLLRLSRRLRDLDLGDGWKLRLQELTIASWRVFG